MSTDNLNTEPAVEDCDTEWWVAADIEFIEGHWCRLVPVSPTFKCPEMAKRAEQHLAKQFPDAILLSRRA